ncbi:MAG: transporter substrate-binding domain-containing protein [Oscillospiraceae bacterium]|jgi:ABC-type amino acid transport substrate-binding protein|nr:transporter substrate-binding domain-containing protein [Oscillospiraceae bacterium]
MKTTQKALAILAALAIIITVFAACTPQTTGTVNIKSPDDFYGHTIAVQNGTTSFELITAQNENRGDKDKITVSAYEDVKDCFKELSAGRVDAVYVDSVVAAYYTQGTDSADYNRVWLDKTGEPLGIGLRKSSTELAAAIEAALDTLYVNGKLKEIALKVFGDDFTAGTRTATTAPEIPNVPDSDLKKAGKLTVGCEIAYPPMEYKQDDGKTPMGFDIDLAKAIAEVLGLEVEFVDTAWTGIEAGLRNKQYDCIISSYSITEARQEVFYQTKPYINQAQCIVVYAGTAVPEPSSGTP